ncbi:heparan-alpha-glucosaminide N-acetyltransferase [Consotaella aegiceratis]|uniref:heparan-alpha-glucosaminide N-acetyltransferase n=1 Tax=Consotaella aegiceratis TaxID=3097961 RepID=UPI002F401265
MSERSSPASSSRIMLLDVSRALALIAMAVYHFGWDLEFFGYLAPGVTGHGAWRLFARTIASTFLVLVGLSLVLAHRRGVRWPAFWKREAQIVASALTITVATFFFTPDAFVFFGILHQIALASLIGLIFLKTPWPLTAAAGAIAIALPWLYGTPILNPRWLAWTGLAEHPPLSTDLVPVFPWTGVVLLGLATGQLLSNRALWDRLRGMNALLAPARPLALVGRHALLFYLLHQPILIALVWIFAQIAPPNPIDVFRDQCQASCIPMRDEAFCRRYCACAQENLVSQGLMDSLVSGTPTQDETDRVHAMAAQCTAEVEQAE